jgi:transposase-like protein
MEYLTADGQIITINNRCHSSVKTAIQCFAEKCKNYTTTSRKFPLWSLLRAHIDQVVANYLKANSINALADQFEKDGFSSFAKGSIRKTVDLLSAEIKRRSPAIEGIVTLEEFFEVQPIFSEPNASVFENNEIEATLDALIYLLEFCETRRPKRRAASSCGAQKVSMEHGDYCELCWRLSAAARGAQVEQATLNMKKSAAMVKMKINDLILKGEIGKEEAARMIEKASEVVVPEWTSVPYVHRTVGVSRRFCDYHAPDFERSRASQYRADLHYREAFEYKIKELYELKQYDENLRMLDESEIRELAYNLVHPRPIKKPSCGWRDDAIRLVKEGVSKVEVARRLGVSRKSIYKAIGEATED